VGAHKVSAGRERGLAHRLARSVLLQVLEDVIRLEPLVAELRRGHVAHTEGVQRVKAVEEIVVAEAQLGLRETAFARREVVQVGTPAGEGRLRCDRD
jgi:hypothetical protein